MSLISKLTNYKLISPIQNKKLILLVAVLLVFAAALTYIAILSSRDNNFDIREGAACETNVAKWTPVEFVFSGPTRNETDPSPNNPFLDYGLNVKFTSPSGRTVNVPGFFDGNGAGGGTGNKWRVRFLPDETGSWSYVGDLRQGINVAVDTNLASGTVQTITPDCATSFNVGGVNPNAPGFFKWGRLDYVGKHYPKFADGPYFIKTGADSPENFLAFAGFDNTYDLGGVPEGKNFLHNYASHKNDWQPGDPTFGSNPELSKNIIGALNYLSTVGVNSIYFLPMNLGGDGQDTFPFISSDNNYDAKTHYDISKLNQWDVVLRHAARRGIALNVVLAEAEDDNMNWLGGANVFTTERKLYIRELIARFGYLPAVQWNMAEESKFTVNTLTEMAAYISALDWSNHQVTYHPPLDRLDFYNWAYTNPNIDATSVHYTLDNTGPFVEEIRAKSAARPWIANLDENTFEIYINDAGHIRKSRMYDILFSGGSFEWWLGYAEEYPGGDLTVEDFRTRDDLWKFSMYARNIMNTMPFWEMRPADELVTGEDVNETYGGAEVFVKDTSVYAVYLPQAVNNGNLDLTGAPGTFTKRWFNPASGNFEGQPQIVQGGTSVNIGSPPGLPQSDWVVVFTNNSYVFPGNPPGNEPPVTPPPVTPPPSPTTSLNRGQLGQKIFEDYGDSGFNPNGKQTFSDIPASHPNYKAVEWLVSKQITSGCGNGKYCPEETANRGEATVFMVRASKLAQYPPAPTTPYFEDVPTNHFAFKEVQQFKKNQITTGCNPPHFTRFCPASDINLTDYNTFKSRIGALPGPPTSPASPTPIGDGANLTAKIKLQGVFQKRPDIQVSIKQVGQLTETKTANCTSDSNGVYSCVANNLKAGNYTILITGPSHLTRNMGTLNLKFGANQADFTSKPLLAGEIIKNGGSDNFINALDIGKVIEDYFPDSPEGSLADLNLDGTVNAIDIGFVIQNYFKKGD